MLAHVDIISQTTGRVLLSSLLDAPSVGISRMDGWEVIKILRQTKKKLEKKFGEGSVRLSLDSYEGTVFWYLILCRGVVFDNDHRTLGVGRQWSLHELLLDGENNKLLKKTDLGVVFDSENLWLAMDWKEARKGIMEGFENCPTWHSILLKQQRRLIRTGSKEKVGEDYWKRCACSYSYTIPRWQLEKMHYLKKNMWHRGQMTYDDLIVLDLAGMDFPKLDDATQNAVLPVAKRARFAHFYTDDPREYRAIQKLVAAENRKKAPRNHVKNIRRVQQQREKRKIRRDIGEEKAAWFDASLIISKIPKLLGSGLNTGHYHKFYSGKQSDQLYQLLLDSYMNGEILEVDINKKLLNTHLEKLESLLEDENVPKEFSKWLKWKGKMVEIRKEIET